MASVAEMQARIDELAKMMTPRQLAYAINLVDTGKDGRYRTQMEAYIAAGFKGASNSNNPGRIAGHPPIREYVNLAKMLASRQAIEAVQYDEQQWLYDAVQGLNMAMGRLEMIVAAEQRKLDRDTGEMETIFEQQKITTTDLKSAARYVEVLGKKLALFTEKKLHGEDPQNPLNSLRELTNIMRDVAEDAQKKGLVRDE